MSTAEKLAQVLHAAGLFDMERKARLFEYDDYKSSSATPIVRLVRDLQAVGAHDLAKRAMNGEFDATKEESAEWFANEGRHLI